ncbi:hypothetical protein V9T40_007606 [Parthenolecanium corni]|uniref:Promethin n=1 Tax=Parthenolecanium corni TaxID=536013 RepID=A0AAN9Y4B9_9HEMI
MNWPVHVAINLERLFIAMEKRMKKCTPNSLYQEYLHYLEYYPVMTILSTISFVTYSIPIAFFIGFGVVTSILTFSGFLLIEGTILGGGLIVLLTVLAIISCGLFSLIFACWSFGYVFSQIFEFASMNVKMEPLAPERERTLSDNHHQFRSSSGISD